MNVLITSDFIFRFIYLILKSVPIMCNDINKENFFNIFKKNRIIKEIVGYCWRKKIVNKGLFILHWQKVVYENH